MGFWGNGLYSNDTSSEVKEQFVEYLREGMDTETITSILIEENEELLDDPFDGRMFWLALADTQWNWGRLLPNVKEKALKIISEIPYIDIESLKYWEHAFSKKKVIKLKEKLLSPQPKEKKPRKQKKYICNWNYADVYALKFTSSLSKESGLLGKYMLFQKIDDYDVETNHITPIVYVKITSNERLPKCTEEYDVLEYVQINFLQYERRFIPIDARRPEEDIREKMKIKYEVDDFGYLREFRIVLDFASDTNIPSGMFYIGNFPDASPPEKEFIPHSKYNISYVISKNMGEEIEQRVIRSYLNHNKKQLSIYNTNG